MSRHLESYVTFLKNNHLPKVTKYFIRETHCTIGDGEISNGKIKIGTLKAHFKNLLNRISDKDILLDCLKEVNQFKKQLKAPSEFNATFFSWYLTYLNDNKNALIHFIPFYTQDMISTMELVEEIERVFSKLEADVLNKIGISRSVEGNEIARASTEYELKQTSEKLKLREEQLLETQKVAKVGSFKWDLERDEISATDEVHRIFKIPKGKNLTLKRFESYLGKKSKKSFREKLITALKHPEYYELEFKIKLPNKEIKYIVIRTKSIQNTMGRATQLLGIIMDISSLKKSEIKVSKKNKEILETNIKLKDAQKKLQDSNKQLDEKIKERTKELKENNERYHSFIKLSSEGIWRYEIKGIDYVDTTLPEEEQVDLLLKHAYFAECNDKMARLHGYNSAEDLAGQYLYDVNINLHSIEEKKGFLKKFIRSGYRVTNFETKEEDKNGETRYLIGSIFGIVEGKKLLSAWGIQRDITDKTKTENSLKQSEEKYRFLAENLPIIFWTAEPNGYLDYGNQIWFDYTGSSPKQYKEIDWKSFIHTDDLERTQKAWMDSISTGKEYETEYRLKDANGKYRWHMGRSYPLKDESGRVIKWMGTSIDIHDQKTYSDKLDIKNKELSKTNNELDNLLYSVAHDLKAPVANIEGLISALESTIVEECKDAGVNELLRMMNNSVDKFKKNLLDTIDIVKAKKRGEETAEENDLSIIVEDVKSDLQSLIDTTSAKIKTDFRKCPSIYFSSKNMKSIFYNLLSNALKYRSPKRKPEIAITSDETEGHRILTVKDNGMGFEANKLTDLTSNRLHKSIEGSGVGLYILKRIMDSAGGRIEVESTKDVGSKFSVYFPKDSEAD